MPPRNQPNAKITTCPDCGLRPARRGNNPCIGCVRSKLIGGNFVCSICHQQKPAEEFHVNKCRPQESLTGIRRDYRCKQCNAIRQRERRRTPAGQFTMAKLQAKNHGKEFSLTFEEYSHLRSMPCHYCGWPLNSTGIALDRKDNSLGYSIDNVVPCCTECNIIKINIFTVEEMLLMGAVVSKIKASRAERGEPIKQGFGGKPRKY